MPFNPLKPFNDLPDLPPAAEIESKTILKHSIAARFALAKLNTSVKSLPNPDVLIHPMTLQEARDSTAIENIVTTDDVLFRQTGRSDEPGDPAVKEALRYRQALYDASTALQTRPIGTNLAIDICRKLKGIDMTIRAVPGTTLRNEATGKVVYTPPAGTGVIRDKLANWEKFIHERTEIDALVRTAVQHYQFEAIHPFPDGNGRTGRILNIMVLLEYGLIDKPVLYLSREFLVTRSSYYKNLNAVTAEEKWEEWIVYFLTCLEASARATALKSQQIERLIQSTKAHLRARTPKLYSHELMDFLFARPYCRIADMVEAGLAKRQTATVYLGQLASLGILDESKSGREKIFVHRKFRDLLTTDGSGVEPYPVTARSA